VAETNANGNGLMQTNGVAEPKANGNGSNNVAENTNGNGLSRQMLPASQVKLVSRLPLKPLIFLLGWMNRVMAKVVPRTSAANSGSDWCSSNHVCRF